MKTYLCNNYKKAKTYFKKMLTAPTISEVIKKEKELLEKEIAECTHAINTAEFVKHMARKRYEALETWEQSKTLKGKKDD